MQILQLKSYEESPEETQEKTKNGSLIGFRFFLQFLFDRLKLKLANWTTAR